MTRRRRVRRSAYLFTDGIGGLSFEARLAGRMVSSALFDAAHGDADAAAWVTAPSSLELWASVLHVEPERLARMARRVLRRRR